jgi:hypothetical protein
MTAFDAALAEYKAALLAVEADLSTDVQRGLYALHVATVSDIEKAYAESKNAYACRLLIEGEGLVHQSNILTGPAFVKMRETFAKLVHAVRDAYVA